MSISKFYSKYKQFIWGVAASIVAQVLYVLFINYALPLWTLHDVKKLYNQGRDKYFNLAFLDAKKDLKSAIGRVMEKTEMILFLGAGSIDEEARKLAADYGHRSRRG